MEAIDLGLSVKWADCNVGATKAEDYGDYYAWGETEPKTIYDWNTYKWATVTYNAKYDLLDLVTLTKYNTSSDYGTVDNKTVLELADDAACVNCGGQWCLPTDAEWTELIDKCKWKWATRNGVKGYTVKSNINGNSIFLPVTGYRYYDDLCSASYGGYYWSSSFDNGYPNLAWYVYFYSGNVYRRGRDRSSGLPVRPVLSND